MGYQRWFRLELRNMINLNIDRITPQDLQQELRLAVEEMVHEVDRDALASADAILKAAAGI